MMVYDLGARFYFNIYLVPSEMSSSSLLSLQLPLQKGAQVPTFQMEGSLLFLWVLYYTYSPKDTTHLWPIRVPALPNL